MITPHLRKQTGADKLYILKGMKQGKETSILLPTITRYNPLCEKYPAQPITYDFALGKARMRNKFKPRFREYLETFRESSQISMDTYHGLLQALFEDIHVFTGKFFPNKKGGTWHNKRVEASDDWMTPNTVYIFGNGKKNSFYGADSRQLRKVLTDLRELPFDIPL